MMGILKKRSNSPRIKVQEVVSLAACEEDTCMGHLQGSFSCITAACTVPKHRSSGGRQLKMKYSLAQGFPAAGGSSQQAPRPLSSTSGPVPLDTSGFPS